MKKVSIIIPTYNERENISKLLDMILKEDFVEEVIVVDDGSKDGTMEVVEKYTVKDRRVKLLERRKKLGLGSAYREGIKFVTCDWFFTMDADLSHDPRQIKDFLEQIQHADILIGSRHVRGSLIIGWSLYRFLTHLIANFLARTLLGLNCKDVTSGYRLYNTKKARSIFPLLKGDRFNFQIEVLFYAERLGLKIKEIPIIFVDRKLGKSKFNFSETMHFFRILIYLLALKFKLPRRA